MGQNGPFLAVVCVHKQVSSALGASDIVAAEDTLRYTAAQDLAIMSRKRSQDAMAHVATGYVSFTGEY